MSDVVTQSLSEGLLIFKSSLHSRDFWPFSDNRSGVLRRLDLTKKSQSNWIVKEISRLPFWWPCRNDNDNFCRMTTWVIEWLAIFCDIHEGDMTEWYWTAFATPCNVSYNICKCVKSRGKTWRLPNPFFPFPFGIFVLQVFSYKYESFIFLSQS